MEMSLWPASSWIVRSEQPEEAQAPPFVFQNTGPMYLRNASLLAAITVFYGTTLGLLAVATWMNDSSAQNRVDHKHRR